MSIKLDISIVGAERVRRGMNALAQHLGEDLRPMLDVVRSWWHTWQGEMFAEQGGPLGRWQELSPKYKAWKDKKHQGLPILELTGALQKAMTGKRGAWHVLNKRDMTIGVTSIPYVFAHNFGIVAQNLPARRFLDVNKDAMRALDKELRHLLADIKRDILREFGGPGGMAR